MNWSVGKIGTIYQKPAQAIGLSTSPIGCVLDLPGLPGAGNKIYDRSPYGNIGTITGAVWKKLPGGLWYLDFDGEDDYVDLGSNLFSNAVMAKGTLMCWIEPDQVTSDRKALNFEDICNIQVDESKAEAYIWDGTNTAIVPSTTTLLVDTWYFLAMTWDGTTLKIYLNGEYENSDSIGSPDFDAIDRHWGLGGKFSAFPPTASLFDGGIALSRAINRALSALEIQNHYQQEKHLFGVW